VLEIGRLAGAGHRVGKVPQRFNNSEVRSLINMNLAIVIALDHASISFCRDLACLKRRDVHNQSLGSLAIWQREAAANVNI
jgi:hypothetical protein